MLRLKDLFHCCDNEHGTWNAWQEKLAKNKCHNYSLKSEYVVSETFAIIEELVLASLQLARTNTGNCKGSRVRSGSESDNSHGRSLLLESVSQLCNIWYTDLHGVT